jgi:hypothetical protein
MQTEPGPQAALVEVMRLAGRGIRHPLICLLCGLGLTALVVGGLVLKEYRYQPKFVLRVVEMDRDPHTAPRPKRHLREHVRDAVFSNTRLAELIEKHGLYPALYRANPIAAITSFREDIEIDVYRNYFVEERSPDDPPRSARIAVSYRSSDRKQGLAVTRDLGKAIIDNEHQNRKRQAIAAAQEAEKVLTRARADVLALRQQIASRALLLGVDLQSAEMRASLLHATPEPALDSNTPLGSQTIAQPDFASRLAGRDRDDQARAVVELIGLKRSLQGAERQLADAESRKADLELGRDLEQGGLGLRFEVIDEGAISESAGIGFDDLLFVGLCTLLLGLPLLVLAVGAFDSKIRDSLDVARLGLRPLGFVDRAFIASRGMA